LRYENGRLLIPTAGRLQIRNLNVIKYTELYKDWLGKY